MNHLPSVELLENTHQFPGLYAFKVIGRTEPGFVARAVAAVRDQLEREVDPSYSVRETSAGRHVSISIEVTVQSAWEVLAVYQRLQVLPAVVFVL